MTRSATAPSTRSPASSRRAAAGRAPIEARARAALDALARKSTRAAREGLARYAIPPDRALGVPMKDIQALARTLGRDHDLALALWDTGVYEARLLAAYVDEPARVAAAQMDRWCREFDNWAICDTLCFVLFDRTAHAWRKVASWSKREPEFERRAAFALLASLALHDRSADDAEFSRQLALIERAATDGRNFVRKSVSWALRAIGGRSRDLHAASRTLARKLAESSNPTARSTGKEALRELARPAVTKRLAAKHAKR